MRRTVRGAHWDLEIDAIAKMLHDTPENPVLLFDDIPGYASGVLVVEVEEADGVSGQHQILLVPGHVRKLALNLLQ